MTELTERRRAILTDVRRYGLLTNEAVRVVHLGGASANAAVKECSRLVAAGYLRRVQTRGLTYYVLGKKAVEVFGELRATRPYGLQALLGRLGVLGFCVESGVTKFTFEEFEQYFPGFHRRGHKHAYFLDQSGEKPKLGYVHVDHGSPPGRVVGKLLKAVRIRAEIDGFRDLMKAGTFVVVAAVPSPGKKLAVEGELAEEPRGAVEFRVEVVPDLLPLLLTRKPKQGD